MGYRPPKRLRVGRAEGASCGFNSCPAQSDFGPDLPAQNSRRKDGETSKARSASAHVLVSELGRSPFLNLGLLIEVHFTQQAKNRFVKVQLSAFGLGET
ncbi:hypothetical protein, partial [Pseudovibrio sp. W74]|uniref:hypothetical protein n=1 Tax=Pseudovibrio sp. W74 TaxID=1735584 RepID=UPI001FCB59B6